MLFFRQIVHLLPRGLAWRVTAQKTLTRLIHALAQAPSDVRDAIDRVWLDISPGETRELARYEGQFGLLLPHEAGLTADEYEAARRQQLAAAWGAQGGQSPRYLQDVVQAAGFNVWLHEWWTPGTTPRELRDPTAWTVPPRIGTVQCGEPLAQCTDPGTLPPDPLPAGVELFDLYPQCNAFLVNEPGYLVNLNLTREAPPAVPADPERWPYFLYWMGQTFGSKAEVPAARRAEFERLLLKLCPARHWIVTYVDFV